MNAKVALCSISFRLKTKEMAHLFEELLDLFQKAKKVLDTAQMVGYNRSRRSVRISWHVDQGQLPKRSNGTDCKSVARASEVRILHCPPFPYWPRPCGAVVAHSLGKTVVVGSIPTTGSRSFRLMLGSGVFVL